MPTSDPSLTVAAWMVTPCPAHIGEQPSPPGRDLILKLNTILFTDYRKACHGPMVTLSPIVVGACCPFGLCRATCTTVPSCMLVLAPMLMAFTSPVRCRRVKADAFACPVSKLRSEVSYLARWRHTTLTSLCPGSRRR